MPPEPDSSNEHDLWERLPVALYRTTPDGRILDVNPEFVERFRYPTRDSLIQIRAEALYVDPQDRGRWRAQLESEGVLRGFEAQMRRADGTTFWAREATRARRDARGDLICYEGLLEDVSEFKRTDGLLRESEASYRRLFENPLNGVAVCEIVTDASGRPIDFVYLKVNQAFERLSGLSPDAVLGKRATSVIPGIEATGLVERYGRVALTGESARFESHVPALKRDFDVAAFSPAPGQFAAVFSDVTARKLAEQKLRSSEQTFRTLAEDSPNMIFVIAAGQLVYANRRCEEVMGISREEGLSPGFDLFGLLAPESLEPARASFRRHQMGEEVPPFEYTLVTREGRRIQGIHTSKLIEFEGRKATLGIVTDITERKRAEEAHARLSLAVEQAAESIVITDPQGTIVYVNPAFERLSGYSRDEALGQNPRILKSGEQDAAFYRQMWATLARGEVWTGRIVNRRKDGTLFEEEATISPVRDASQQLVNYVAVKRDITNETRLERQLFQAQKMEAIGRLAGGVAHDFNNLLGVITGYGEMVLRRLGAEHPVAGKMEQILRAADRAAGLTRQLLAFGRRQVLQPRVLDLNAVVSDMEKMLRRLIGEDVELATLLEPSLGSVRADPGQIEQILMNLAVNARDAMPEGGRITVQTGNSELDAGYAASRPPTQPGRYVMLAVSDTGSGMDAATQAHIFEPFFTTKKAGKGTGLGLATVYGIVKQSDGFIWVYSEPGVGTTFKIYLPRVDEEAEIAREEGQPGPLRGSETVLLVEDETVLRDLFREALEAHGYSVLMAHDGAEAVQRAAAHAGPIQLIVTDVIMPGMTGPKVVEVLAPTRPKMKVLYVSGYSDEFVVRSGVLGLGAAFLSKPFGPDVLLRKVRELLDSRPEAG